MQNKLKFSFGVILALLFAIIAHMLFIYYRDGDRYSKAVLSHLSYSGSEIPYMRGEITDRNGSVLATSQAVYNVVLDPSVIYSDETEEHESRYVEPTLNALAEVFGMDKDELLGKISVRKDAKYMVIRRSISYEEMNSFKKFKTEADEDKDNDNPYKNKIKGVWFELEYRRVYPQNELASHVIGYTNAGNVGSYGIEQYYNDYLNGENGRTYGYYDSNLEIEEKVIPAKNGGTVVSTIDSFSQAVVEDEIEKFIKKYQVKNIGVILMNPNNGEIYAMASNKEYDLNNPRNLVLNGIYTSEEYEAMSDEDRAAALNRMWRNFCISDTYEPGSTFKLATVAAALEEDAIEANEVASYNCPGGLHVGKWYIRCSNRNGHGQLTLTRGIEQSCNCVLMEIGEALGKEDFLKYQTLLGFGKKTGLDIPGEASGILIPEDKMGAAELATSTFGQSFNVSMVQMAAAYCSLINGGYYYQPHLVSKVVDADGFTVYTADENYKRITVSPETSEYLRYATEMVVKQGTGRLAGVEGYRVGGKTGTAQKGDRKDRLFVVSFISSVPADNPQLVAYVVIDQIEDKSVYNSSRPAATMTSDILKRVLPHLGIYPESGEIDYNIGAFDEVNEGDVLDEEGNSVLVPGAVNGIEMHTNGEPGVDPGIGGNGNEAGTENPEEQGNNNEPGGENDNGNNDNPGGNTPDMENGDNNPLDRF